MFKHPVKPLYEQVRKVEAYALVDGLQLEEDHMMC